MNDLFMRYASLADDPNLARLNGDYGSLFHLLRGCSDFRLNNTVAFTNKAVAECVPEETD